MLWVVALVAIIAALGYRVSVLREPPPPPVSKILFVTGGSGPYWQSTVAGAKAAARGLDVDLKIEMPADDESLEQQTAILTGLDANLDGVALSPLDAGSQTELINGLVKKMRVVTFDSDAEESDRHSHIGTSNFSAGRACARLVNEALPEGGKVAVLLANQTKENLIDRKGGFRERIGQLADDVEKQGDAPRYTIVGYFEDGGSDAKCGQNIRAALAANADLACFVGMNARHGPVLLKVLGEMNKLGEVTLITFDAADETLEGIEAGHIYATIAQDPYNFGFEAVKTLSELCRGHGTDLPIVGKGSNYVGAEAIRRENLEKFRGLLRARQEAAEGATERTAKKPAA
jgi:ribose transport system substrate-binding protein